MSENAPNSVTLRFLAAPTDVGHSGSVDAGTVLEWVDKAAYAAAVGWAKSYCVTAYVGNIHFADPVNIGDMVEVTATIVYTGRSSMHIRTVVSSGDPKGGPATMRSQCMVIFVAVGEDGKPIPVPQYEPSTPAEIEQRDHALARIKVREDIVQAMSGQEYTDAGTAERVTLLRDGHGGGLLRRRAVLPAAAHRPPRGGGGPAGLHRDEGHAHCRPRPLRRSQGARTEPHHVLPDCHGG